MSAVYEQLSQQLSVSPLEEITFESSEESEEEPPLLPPQLDTSILSLDQPNSLSSSLSSPSPSDQVFW